MKQTNYTEGFPAARQLLREKLGYFRRDGPACEPSAFAVAATQFVQPGAAGKPWGAASQGTVGSEWLNLAVHAQLSWSQSLSPALPTRRGFR